VHHKQAIAWFLHLISIEKVQYASMEYMLLHFELETPKLAIFQPKHTNLFDKCNN